MNIKELIKNNKILKPIYTIYKKNKYHRQFKFHGTYIDRSKHCDKLCIILSGYKPYLYENVFGRIERFMPKDIDVCIVTSGLFSEEMDLLCEKNHWSYLSTKENHVSLVQNVAILKHPNAKWIYKLDEDIFITENYFEKMMAAYNHAKSGKYKPGVIAPILPINGYGYFRVLEKLDLIEQYEKCFGKAKIAASENRKIKAPIETSVDIAKFFWGKGGYIPGIDELNDRFGKEALVELPCAIRFSIGAVMFERSLWEDMDHFDVDLNGNSMGKDEVQICKYCCISSRPIMVSENIVVGHFSFGPQNAGMKEFYENNKKLFVLDDK